MTAPVAFTAVPDWVRALRTYEPGRPLEDVARDLGLPGIEGIAKLASNEAPLGPSPKAVAAMRAAAARMHLYPDGYAHALRARLADRLGVGPDHLLFGNGSNELIELLFHALAAPGAEVVASECAFLVYKLVAAAFQIRFIEAPMRDLTHDLEAMAAAITPDTRLVFVANPNNPTGTRVANADLDRFIEGLPEHVVVAVDEAYAELLDPEDQPDTLRHVRAGRPVVVLRTFSKTYGLAGLRLGYAIARPAGIQLLERFRQPFNVNAMAQAAAVAALEDEAFLEETRRTVREGRAWMERALHEAGFETVPSEANFLLVKTGAGRETFQALMRERIIVRPLDAYGLPDHIRVTIGRPEENRRFVEALAGLRV